MYEENSIEELIVLSTQEADKLGRGGRIQNSLFEKIKDQASRCLGTNLKSLDKEIHGLSKNNMYKSFQTYVHDCAQRPKSLADLDPQNS
jgi:hypothetical protein